MTTGIIKSPASLLKTRFFPIAIVIFSIVIAVLIARDHYRLTEWAIKERLTEAKHAAASSAEHVEEYFDAVYSTLNYISFSPEVQSMSESCRPIIQNVFDFHREKHRLIELFLIKKDFDGTRPTFMEFEPPLHGQNREEVHSLAREAEEYAVQIDHISRFVRDPSLKSLVSGRLLLCVDELGLIMSVPVKRDGELVGIVAAMMPEKRLIAELKRGQPHGKFILFNDENEFYSSKELDQQSLEDFERIRQRNASRYSKSLEPSLTVNGRAISMRINAYGDRDWLMIYDFASEANEVDYKLSDAEYIWGPVLSVLILGFLVAGLMEIARRRHEENLLNLKHIKKTEESLRKSEKWLSTTLSSIGDAVIATDKSSSISFMNRVAEEITGWSKEEAVGQPLSKVFRLNVVKSGRLKGTSSSEALREDTNFSTSNSRLLIDKSGVEIPVDTSTAPIRSEDGETLGSVIIFRDVTGQIETENRLRQGRDLLKSILESTADGMLVVGQSGEVLHANTRFADLWRIPDELLQSGNDEKLLRFVLEQLSDPDAFVTKVKKLYKCFETDLDILQFKDGREFERFSCPLIQDNDVTGRVWSFRDITEQKQADKKLEELAQLPLSNPNGIITLKVDGTVLYQNPFLVKLLAELQLSRGQIGRILPENYLSLIKTCSEEKRPLHNNEATYKGHTWLWVFSPVPDQEIIHAFATEITDRIQYNTLNLKLSAAVSQSENSIIITDNQGLIEYVNPKFETVSGYSLSECKGKSNRLLKSGRHTPEFYRKLWETIMAGKTWAGNILNRNKSGELYWEHEVISPILDNNGKIIGFLSIGEDITKELHKQQTLIESDKLSAIGMLAAGVAHEFKNYLGGIIGNASFALDHLDSKDGLELARDTLTKVIDIGEQANDIAMSLLSYSRADPEDFGPEDIREIVRKSIVLVEKEMLGFSIEIASYFEDVPDLRLSASKIQQLLLNLLINARQAINNNGVITLAVKAVSGAVEVRVADTGCGIEEEILSRIFDPFYSTKGVWGKDGVVGIGMGLAISRNIAREHNGDLTVESIPGIGTTFTLTIPQLEDCDDTSLVDNAQCNFSAALFTQDRTIISSYFKQACRRNVKISNIDNIDSVRGNFMGQLDFAICDAKFADNLDFNKFTELCRQNNVPFFMIRCDTKEYQLPEVHESAVTKFKDIPDIGDFLNLLPQPDKSKALT